MKTKLNMAELLEKAEEMIYDGRIEMAESGKVPVQILEADNGNEYQLSLVMELIKK